MNESNSERSRLDGEHREGALVEPIDVCELSKAEVDERIAWTLRELMPWAIGRVRIAGGIALEFADRPGVVERLDHWVELERRCCGSIDWERTTSPLRGQVRVEIRGVNPESPVFAALPWTEIEEAKPPSSTKRRVARILWASGLGTAVSLFVCCVLPLILSTLAGATLVASSLAWLDDPLWISLGAVAGGVVGAAASRLGWGGAVGRVVEAARETVGRPASYRRSPFHSSRRTDSSVDM